MSPPVVTPDSWGGNVNGVELTDSGTLVRFEGTDPSFQAQYNRTNPIDLGGATTVNFVYSTTPGFTPVANAFSFTAAPAANVGVGQEFKLGTFTFTNGQWYPDADLTFTLTTHSPDASLDGKTFEGTIHLLSIARLTTDPFREADIFYINERRDLGAAHVFDLDHQPPGNPGNVGSIDIYGRIDSLVPTRLVAANPAAFIEAVPEPTTLAALAGGLGWLGIAAWRRRR
jgi:hypothetical protein